MVDARQRGRLAEVRGVDSNPHPKQPRQLLLVPAYGLWIAEVYYRIIDRRFAVGAQDDVAFLGSFFVQFVFGVEVRKLPEAHSEAALLEVREHLLWVFEARVGELEVAAVGPLSPAGVEVDHVGGDAVFAQLPGDLADLFFGGVGLAAHPQAKRPEWRDGGAPGERCVLGEDLLGSTEKEEQIELVVAQVDYIRLVVRAAKVEGERRARVDEHPVAAAAQEEGYRLVHVRRLGTVGVVGVEDQLLATLVQACEGLPAPKELLVRREGEAGRKVPVQIGGVAHEREGRGHRVDDALGIGEVVGASQEPARSVPELEAHRIFVDAQRPERSLVGRAGFGSAHLPGGVVGRRGHHEHEGGFVLDPTRTGGEPEAHGLRSDERERKRKRLLVLVFLWRCILPYLVVLKLERELMVGDSLLEGAAPPENLAGGGVGVKLRDLRADEEVVLLLCELLTDIHRLVLKSSLVLFHRRSPSFPVSALVSGLLYSPYEAKL